MTFQFVEDPISVKTMGRSKPQHTEGGKQRQHTDGGLIIYDIIHRKTDN